MEEKRIEEILKEKLHSVEIDPPAGMWARIEQGLADVRREDAFSQAQQESDVPAQISIRRPKRNKIRFTYVAASIAAVITVAALVRNMDVTPEQFGTPGYADNVLVDPATLPDRVDSGNEEPSINGSRGGAALGTQSHLAVAAGTFTEDVTDPAEPADVYAEGSKTEEPGPEQTTPTQKAVHANGTPQKDPNSRTNDKTSDMKSGERFAARMPANAEYGRRTRRTGPGTSASIFAMNGGGMNGGGNINGNVVMNSGGMLIVENPDGTTSEIVKNTTEVRDFKHQYPISVGASVSIGLVDRLSLETGLMYTYLKSEAESGEIWSYSVKQKLHYLGIPVKVKYDFVDARLVDCYVAAGGALEKCVSGTYSFTATSKDNVESLPAKEKLNIKGVQASVGANLGVEFKADQTFGIYFEPGINYYFKNSSQPESYRTDNPLNFTLRAGLRIKL